MSIEDSMSSSITHRDARQKGLANMRNEVSKNDAGRTSRPANSSRSQTEADGCVIEWAMLGGTGGSNHALDLGPALRAAASTTAGLTRLLIKFTTTHLLLDPGVLDQLSKPLDRIVDRLVIPQPQLDHTVLPSGLLKVFRADSVG